jgi:hypothetical protein
MTAIGCLIALPVFPEFRWLDTTGLILLWVSAALTVQTGLAYFQASASHFKS